MAIVISTNNILQNKGVSYLNSSFVLSFVERDVMKPI